MESKEFVFSKELLEETDVLCLFGFDFIDVQKQLESWLSLRTKHLFIVQKENSYNLEDFWELAQKNVFQKFSYVISSSLSESEKSSMEWLFAKCQAIEWNMHLKASDYQDFGVRVFHNLCSNYTKKAHRKKIDFLKDSLKGIPAFICGGGPSLREAAPYLQEIEGKGVVFAGGSALGALSDLSIQFHIATGIDPDPSYERCLMRGSFESLFFYQDRFSSALLDQVQGSLFEVPCELGLRLEDSLGFDGGCTVTTFSAALAVHFGCSPIVFVGMDLSYEDEDQKYFQKSAKEDFRVSVIYEEKFTQKDWVIAAKWLENLANSHSHIPFYNVSQKGLSLEGVQKISWENLFQERKFYLYDIVGRVHALQFLGEEECFVLEERLEKIKNIQKSFANSLAIIENVFLLFEKEYPEDPTCNGTYLLHLFALYDEIVYQQLLEPLWKVWRFPIERNLESSYEKSIHQWLFFKKVIQEHLA